MLSDPRALLVHDPQEIHIWQANLATPAAMPRALLSADERQRAARFMFERDRVRFTVARAGLRRVLSVYTGIQPELLGFAYTQFGKPYLAEPEHARRFTFNLSHSDDLALYAVALERRVGIDIEDTRRDCEFSAIAKTVFSAQEQAELAALPQVQARQGFYNAWVRKEAFIKAHGEGFSYPLDRFHVSLRPDAPVTLQFSADPAFAAQWEIFALDIAAPYSGALVGEGRVSRLRYFVLDEDVV